MDTPGAALRVPGPLDVLDGALAVVRRGGPALVVRAWLAGGALALVAIGLYDLERVEGVRSLRPAFAVAITLAWWWRALRLGAVARAYALTFRPNLPMSVGARSAWDAVCTASVVGLGMWLWLWPMGAVVLVSPLLVAAVLPFAAARGAVAPSWLARSACARGRGWSAFGDAVADTTGMRGVFLIVELMLLFGTLGLFANLYALVGVLLVIAHSIFGLDVAFVSSFVSPDNELVLLLVAAVTLVLMEPLHAAVSARAFVDARSRQDGADLHEAIDHAIASSRPRRRGLQSVPPTAAAAWLACALAPTGVHAQPAAAPAIEAPPPPTTTTSPAVAAPAAPRAEPSAASASLAPVPALPRDAHDEEARDALASILRGHEFREFGDSDDRRVGEWFERFLRWLADLFASEDEPQIHTPLRLPLPPAWLLVGILLVVVALVVYYATRGQNSRSPPPVADANAPTAYADRPPDAWLDEASRLAAAGDLRAALRSLYLATLAALDRAGLIQREASRTNGQYLRAMPRGEARKLFHAFTQVFDRSWYGHQAVSAVEYEDCRRIAERLRGAGVGAST